MTKRISNQTINEKGQIVSLTKNDTRYIPQKVVDLALDLGVHPECVEADYEESCERCANIFHTAFDAFYGHAENSTDAMMMILSDILDDRNTDLR